MITQTHLQNLFMGPELRLGERCPCKAEAPGSNPGGSILLVQHRFVVKQVWRENILNDFPCISNPTSTN